MRHQDRSTCNARRQCRRCSARIGKSRICAPDCRHLNGPGQAVHFCSLIFFLALATSITIALAAQAQNPNKEVDWETAIAGGPRDFLDLIQALAGRDPKPETVELLQGVTQIARKGDSFELTRADQSVLQLAPDSDRGAKWLEGWSKIESTAQEDFGDTAGSFIRNISAITKRGSRIEIDRSGPSELMVDL